MKKIALRLLYFFIALSLYFIPSTILQAADFQADYDTQYAVSPTGTTIVTQNITLTNKQSNLYPKQYTISIDSENIKNVIAYDQKGVITPKITQQDGTTNITVQFNEKIVGIDKKLVFNIRYENADIARQLGNIWEIHIPGVENDESLGEYTVSLQTPASFPQNAYMTPLPASGNRWTKEQLIYGGINAAYGEFQSYVANLTYPLENDTLSAKLLTLTIPADNAYQTISIDSVTPKPKEMKKDADGNWIASFELTAKQRVDVVAKLHIQTYNKPKTTYSETVSDVQAYLKQDRYWETQNSTIQDLAKKYTTPRAIYNYVVETLNYQKNDTDETIRKGAVTALTDPNTSVCTEFTDLFIALARAAGIPAREVIGYAYTTDTRLRPLLTGSDVLHAWPEYYDGTRKQWVQIDPTWAHTTGGINYFDVFDFNHIAFVIHGISSETPYPAGSYKEGTIPRKNVSVTFAPVVKTIANASFRTTFLLPSSVHAGKSLDGSIQIENLGNVTAPEVNIAVDANPYVLHVTNTEKAVPPFGILTVPIHIPITSYVATGKGTIDVSVNGEITSFTYTVTPMYWLLIPIGFAGISFILCIWWILRKK
ncbi:MAG: transglutaminase domain-containing protein [Microgenomates group bacterium]